MAGLSCIARSYAVCFVISLQVVQSIQSVESQDNGPQVLIAGGLIRGVQQENYSMFLGIPYGKVDKKHPFGPAVAPDPFDEVFEADDDTKECPQFDPLRSGNKVTGTLDCLHLNIYVPDPPEGSAAFEHLLPVLVWIHGGGHFETGSGRRDVYGPEFLVRHDIVIVTLNYRLGIYGFLCRDPERHFNQGLKDQRLAFRWIADNIEAFGGDPNQMTLAGEGSGSVCVDVHLHTHQARLFSKFILQGQTILFPSYKTIFPNNDGDSFKSILENVKAKDLDSKDAKVLTASLEKANPNDVVKAVGELGLEFGLCIEKSPEGVDKILEDDPKSEKWHSQGTPKPILIGSSADAMVHEYSSEDNMTTLAAAFNDVIRGIMNQYDTKDDPQTFVNITRSFYIGEKKINKDVKFDLIDFHQDYNVWQPLEKSIAYYLGMGAKVYRYVFSYIGGRNYMRDTLNLTQAQGGAIDADELGYLFDMKMFDRQPHPQDQFMIDRITTLWANFIKNGDPTNGEDPKLVPISWPPVTKASMPYLALNAELRIADRPFKKRMAFWKMFYTYLNLHTLKK